MKTAIKKADILIQAIPYIKRFRDKFFVIKYGGSAIEDKKARFDILEDIVFMRYVGIRPILVHGGGPSITKKLKKRGIPTHFIDGYRATDRRTLGVVNSVLESLNADIRKEIVSIGADAISFNRRHGLIKAVRHRSRGDIGFVGDVSSVDTALLKRAAASGSIPVIAPIARGRKGIFNINADEAAYKIAASIRAEKLIVLTNVRGIFTRGLKASSLISTLNMARARSLIKRRVINKGMIPKVESCISALKRGVKKAHIVSSHIKHALLLEIFTDKGIGTEIVR